MVELTMTVLLVGVLAAIVIPKMVGPRVQNKNTEAKLALTTAFASARGYLADTRSYENLCADDLGPDCNNKISLHSLSNQISEVELDDNATPRDSKGAPRGAVWMGDGVSGADPSGVRKNYIVLCSLRQGGDTILCIKDEKGVLSYARVEDEDATVASVGNDPDAFSQDTDLDGKAIAQTDAQNGADVGVETDSPPVNDTPPSFTGTARVSESLLGTPGIWSGRPTPTYTYQWQRCEASGQGCVSISGAIASAYTLTGDDVGKRVRLEATASNLAGDASALSELSAIVEEAAVSTQAPVNTTEPSISGTTKLGSNLTASPGSWDGNPAPSYAYQWRRCDAAGSACVNIENATSDAYQLKSADVGKTVRVKVTATNSEGSANATSPPRGPVASPPTNASLPSVTGTLEVGRNLGVDEGAWNGYPSPDFTYQWQRCDSDGQNCANLDGETSSSYEVRFADRGNKLRVRVTGTNSAGNDVATSPATDVVPGGPVNTSPPTISGDPDLGSTLTANKGSWDASPEPNYSYQWQRCDRDGDSCSDINGASETTYQVARSDGGFKLRVEVRAVNSSGGATASSSKSQTVTTPPQSTARPSLSGSANVGQSLSTSNGAWDGYPEPSFTYQWVRCNYYSSECSDLNGANASSYQITDSDSGFVFRAVVTATNSAGSAEAETLDSELVVNPPTNSTPPSISGDPRVGNTLNGVPGTWTGSPNFTFQWQRCDSQGGGCVNIEGANSQTLLLTDDDTGKTIVFGVRAENTTGEARQASEPVGPVTRQPSNTAIPIISGTASRGSTLTASTGDWLAYPNPSFDYQWSRCDSNGQNCQQIDGATSSSYTAVSGDAGKRLRVQVTATNSLGSASASSAAGSEVTSAPVNTSPPTVSGTRRQGEELSASPGSWDAYPEASFAYRWQRCDSSGDNCVSIDGATASTYTQVQADAGKRLRVRVTASNSAGDEIAYSSAGDPTEALPWNISPPTISGTAKVGVSLSGDVGSWGGFPAPSYTYQWRFCDENGDSCDDIPTATSVSYTPTSAYRGKTLRLRVTATNSVGPQSEDSAPTARVLMSPVSDTAPVLSASPVLGQSFSVSDGTWLSYPDPNFTYQWQRCPTDQASCSDIVGETSSSYTPVSADVASRLRAVVTASNSEGSASEPSALSDEVAAPPTNSSLPTITGDARAGETLSGFDGLWGGYPTPVFTYQWQRCDSEGANCVDIAGATSASFALTGVDGGKRIRFKVTASNIAGSLTEISEPTEPVIAEPVNSSPPELSGSPIKGEEMSVSQGSWVNNPASYAYQWQRCDSAGINCVDIDGATSSSYTVSQADVESTLRAGVVATNSYGSGSAFSGVSEQVRSAPDNSALPQISGTLRIFEQLSVSSGTWTGFPAPSLAYQWQVSSDGSSGWLDISGETATSYTVDSQYSGKYLRVKVTGTNSVQSTVVYTSSELIVGVPLANQAPSVSGTAIVGDQLSAGDGTWYGDTPLSFAYQWQRSADGSSGWSDIAGETSASYTVQVADTEAYLRVKVTATNSVGSASNQSSSTSQVQRRPAASVNPSLAGSSLVGGELNLSPGTWVGFPNPSLSYSWLRCNSDGSGCSAIAGQSSLTYTLTQADAGKRIAAKVDASNAVGSASFTTSQTEIIRSEISLVSAPAVSGNVWTGGTVTSSEGSWNGYPAPTFTYQWQLSGTGSAPFTDIDGATSSSYTISEEQGGQYLRVKVTATNELGSVVAYSSPTTQVASLPTNSVVPSISGTSRVGEILTGSSGTWSGYPSPTLAFQWQRCNVGLSSCSNISGATDEFYTLQPADASGVVRLKVTGSTPKGSLEAFSSASDPIPSASGCTEGVSGEFRVHTCYVPAGQDYQMPSSDTQTVEVYRSLPSDVLLVGGGGSGGQNRGGGGGGGGVVTNSLTLSSGNYSVVVGTGGGSNTTTCTGGQELSGSSSRLTSPGGSTLFTANGGGGGGSHTPSAPVGCSSDSNVGGNGGSGGGAAINFFSNVFSGGSATVGQGNAGGSSRATASNDNRCTGGGGGAGSAGAGACQTPNGGSGRSSSISGVSTVYGGGGGGAAGRTGAESFTTTSAGSGGSGGGGAGAGVDGGAGSAGVNGLGGGGGGSNSSAAPVKGGSGVVIIRYRDPMKPSNTSLPSISGTPAVGQSLTAQTGAWAGYPALSYTYQWQRSDNGSSGWADISGATSTTLSVTADDSARYFRVRVTGTNEAGTATASSPATAQVGVLPTNTSLPSVSGATVVGSVLSGTSGAWSGAPAPTFAYQWQRSDNGSSGWADISGATAQSYSLVSADGDQYLRLKVVGSNYLGSETVFSAASSKVTQPPQAGSPSLSGTNTVGQALTVSPGSWGGFPAPTLTYKWQRSDNGSSDWVDISGQTALSYTLLAADAGKYVRAQVVGTNSSSSVTASTSAQVVNQPPQAGSCSTSGTSAVGQSLTASCGSWGGFPAPTLTYQWQFSNDGSSGWTNLSGATSSTYTISAAVGGKYLRVSVTGTNSLGSANATSSASYVSQPPQAPVGYPTISGLFRVGQVLTGDPGSWGGFPAPTLTYQWQSSADGSTGWSDLAGATSESYTVTSGDSANYLRLRVTGVNASGTVSATSTPAQVSQAPVAGTPSVSGTPTQGQTLTASPGTWGGFPAPTLTYQWQSSLDGATVWTNLTGATSQSYTTTASEVGRYIRVQVTGTNSVSSASATASASDFIASLPVNTIAPTVAGTAFLGQTLVATSGTWTGNPTPVLSYQWQRCSSADASSCTSIPGATAASYTLVSGDNNSRVRVTVSGANRAGSASTSSTMTAIVNSQPPSLSWSSEPATPQLTGVSSVSGSWTLGGGTPTAVECSTDGANWVSCSSTTSHTWSLGAACSDTTVRVRATNPGGSASLSKLVHRNCAAPSVNLNFVPPDWYLTTNYYDYTTTNASQCSYTVSDVPWGGSSTSSFSCTVGSRQRVEVTRPQGWRRITFTVTNADGSTTNTASHDWFSGPSTPANGDFETGNLFPSWSQVNNPAVYGSTADTFTSATVFDGSWRGYAATYYNDRWAALDGGQHVNRCDGLTWASRPTTWTYYVYDPGYPGDAYSPGVPATTTPYTVRNGVLGFRVWNWNGSSWVLTNDLQDYQGDTNWVTHTNPGQASGNIYCSQQRLITLFGRTTGQSAGNTGTTYAGWGGGYFDNVAGTNTGTVGKDTFATGGSINDVVVSGQKWRVHTFTQSGTFKVNPILAGDSVEYLVVGGGGAGGSSKGSAGGGGGGYIEGSTNTAALSYGVTVGGGGSPQINGSIGYGNNGGNSSVFGATAIGGGGGGGTTTLTPSFSTNSNGRSGGSGGGGASWYGVGSGGAGTPGQGSSGGVGRDISPVWGSGGGGGAGLNGNGNGADGGSTNGGNGGAGRDSAITGSWVRYGGGGGGGFNGANYNGIFGGGGSGGGGNAAYWNGGGGTNGLGGGGGGCGTNNNTDCTGGWGGSGIVIIRYRIP